LYSITGPLAPELVPYGQAFNAYVAQQNAKGGVFGRKIIVDSADDQASTTVAPAAAQTLIEQKGVFALAGASVAIGTFATLMHSRNVPFISFPYGNSVVWQQGFSNMISIVGLPSKNANLGLAIWGPFLKSHGVKRVGIITDIEPGTIALGNGIASAAKAAGIQVPYVNNTIPLSQQGSFGGVVATMKADKVDAVIWNGSPQTGQAILSAMQQDNFQPKVAFPNEPTASDFASDPQTRALTKGTWGNSYTTPPSANTPAARAFVSTMVTYGRQAQAAAEQLSMAAVWGYETAVAIVQGLQDAGKNPTRASFLAALRKITNFTGGGMSLAPVNLGSTEMSNPPDIAGPPYCIWFEQFNGQVYVPQPKPYCGGLLP
jgi:ABC-type branched-subunit amino acid transport system substrate-binding protein